MHSESRIIASRAPFTTLQPFVGLPNYPTYSYVMSSLSTVTTSPPA
ncbi:hypothetical protein CMUS01_10146 [Colletotrichum musicola]|uniref:Uncharacterized protein n=1 Tax=Colletotrichum musicola TaxID=2175873 RepID=A0A8H6N8W6_9PEZI|nr:hypothetical protein CMUS01_10146 [Colletotrichum musicola]